MFKKHITCIAVLAIAIIVGCSDPRTPKGPTGTVSGAVKYKGEPVTVGFIVFQEPTTKKGGSASLEADGKYTIPIPMEVGEYNVGFPPPEPPPPHEETKPIPSPLPSKYHIPEQGVVKYTVIAGQNTADFNLE